MAGLAGSDPGAERGCDLGWMAGLGHGSLRGGRRGKPGAAVRVGGVQQPAAQLGDDVGAGPGRAWQRGCDLGQVILADRAQRCRCPGFAGNRSGHRPVPGVLVIPADHGGQDYRRVSRV